MIKNTVLGKRKGRGVLEAEGTGAVQTEGKKRCIVTISTDHRDSTAVSYRYLGRPGTKKRDCRESIKCRKELSANDKIFFQMVASVAVSTSLQSNLQARLTLLVCELANFLNNFSVCRPLISLLKEEGKLIKFSPTKNRVIIINKRGIIDTVLPGMHDSHILRGRGFKCFSQKVSIFDRLLSATSNSKYLPYFFHHLFLLGSYNVYLRCATSGSRSERRVSGTLSSWLDTSLGTLSWIPTNLQTRVKAILAKPLTLEDTQKF